MQLQTLPSRGSFQPAVMQPAGKDSAEIAKALDKSIPALYSLDFPARRRTLEWSRNVPLEERLYDARALCKIRTAAVAMHLDREWQSRLFLQIDSLMDAENWEKDDVPVTEASFITLLRLILLIRPRRRPGLGSTSAGNIIAAWTVEKDRLTIECLPHDKVRWVLSRESEDHRESAAGHVSLSRLAAVLSPYNPERWFDCEGG
jgi:hypothetical protein